MFMSCMAVTKKVEILLLPIPTNRYLFDLLAGDRDRPLAILCPTNTMTLEFSRT